jgi:hypothetical protein
VVGQFHHCNGFAGGPMSEDQYRHYAVECLLLAKEMRNSAHESLLLGMAQIWIALADQIAKRARVRLSMKAAPEGEEPA